MSNVVQLFKPKVNPEQDFIENYLLPWAEAQKVDLHSAEFKNSAAAIMVELREILVCSLKN